MPRFSAINRCPAGQALLFVVVLFAGRAMTLLAQPLAPDSVAAPASVETVSLPLSLDYPLLEKLLRRQLFTGDDETLDLRTALNPCTSIVLQDPRLGGQDAQIEVRMRIAARVGFGAGGGCSELLSFDGTLSVLGVPRLTEEGTGLTFDPKSVWLADPSGSRVDNETLMGLALSGVRSVFAGYEYDFTPQLQAVGAFLPSFLPRHSRDQIERLIQSLRVTELHPAAEKVEALVRLSIDEVPSEASPQAPLSPQELARWEQRWQAMDALLVLAVKYYAAATSLEDLRDALLDRLIESRYRLRDALAEPASRDEDLVRAWFLDSWAALAPVLRRVALEQPGQEHLLLLDVLTAADALRALDQVGPAVGLDISVDGLRRLARMIAGDEGVDLIYSTDVDEELRRLFERRLERGAGAWRIDLSFFPRAVAADADRLNSWSPKPADLPEYLPSVARLLEQSAREAIDNRALDERYQGLFRDLVLTTAWQESCWRHYVVSAQRKLVPLRSGTGDVGLMQINERVWRGFYDQQRLRWDIEYNSAAGAEVLIDYLLKYALRKGEHRQPGGMANLVRASYSAYNGGPSRVDRYRNPSASAYGRKVDAAFWDKYQQVAAGNELAVSTCLGGNLSGRAGEAIDPRPARQDAAGGAWVLQLGAFRAQEAAEAFLRDRGLVGRARVHRRDSSADAPFLVLFGSFDSRARAEEARASLGDPDAWPRPRGDL